MTKVTVITGYYNRCDVLRQTIESILQQTFSDLNLIVFDDCSTDGTDLALQALALEFNDPRLTIRIHQQNTGFVQGLVDAISTCSSEYIAIQGSGDVSLPNRLIEQVRVLDDNPNITAVGCWYDNVVAETTIRRNRRPNANSMSFVDLLKQNVFSHGEVMFRRSAYDAVGGYRTGFVNCQDYDLWLRLIKVGPLATVPETLYERFVRFDGVSYKPQKLALQLRYEILARTLATLDQSESHDLYERLANGGPSELVSTSDPQLQKALSLAALRSIIWGGTKEAKEIARSYITSKSRAITLLFLANAMGSPLAKPLLNLIRRRLGVSA